MVKNDCAIFPIARAQASSAHLEVQAETLGGTEDDAALDVRDIQSFREKVTRRKPSVSSFPEIQNGLSPNHRISATG
jgi:hypothetical protein